MSRLHTLNESISLCGTGSPTKECETCVWSARNSEQLQSICVWAFHNQINKIPKLNRLTSEALG